jgi:hypothetical protein
MRQWKAGAQVLLAREESHAQKPQSFGQRQPVERLIDDRSYRADLNFARSPVCARRGKA